MTASRRPDRLSSRRRFLLAGGVVLTAGLAGCQDTTPPTTDTPTETPTNTPDASPTPTPQPSSSQWNEAGKLVAGDGDSGDRFGTAVALSRDGSTGIVGSVGDEDPHGDRAGSAYVFERADGTWRQEAKLTAEMGKPGDGFGRSVALSRDGTVALVAAPGFVNSEGETNGSVSVFEWTGGTWQQQSTLTANDGDSGDHFGWSVGLSSDGATALVGAVTDEDPNGEGAGSVYVFERGDETWRQQSKLAASDGDSTDWFGSSLAVSDDGKTVLVAAWGDDEPNGEEGGSAYVFEWVDGTWRQQSKLAAEDGTFRDGFGWSVALSGDGATVLIGPNNDDNSSGDGAGSAYVFERSDGSWSQRSKLTAEDGDENDHFGWSVALSGNGSMALIGAYSDEDPNEDVAGSGYVFERENGIWRQQDKLAAGDGDTEDQFGWAAALSRDGTTAFLSAVNDEDPNGEKAGSVYVFERSNGD